MVPAEHMADISCLRVMRLLDVVRIVGGAGNSPIWVHQASNSVIFDKVTQCRDRSGGFEQTEHLLREMGEIYVTPASFRWREVGGVTVN